MDGEIVKVKPELKRQRSENWTEEDKELLKELVKKSVSTIENKNTDTNTNQNKKKAWLELEREFNSLNAGEIRTVLQLKNQWTKLKIQAKKEVSELRAQYKKTGGGQAPAGVALSGNDIAAWLPNEFVIEENEFDSDMNSAKNHQNLEGTSFMEIEYLSEEEEYVSLPKETPNKKKKLSTHKITSVEEHVSEPHTKSLTNTPKLVPKETPKNKKTTSFVNDNVCKIASVEVECRLELHELQMEVERKRIRNLDREYELIEAKIKFYENKSIGTYAFIKEEYEYE